VGIILLASFGEEFLLNNVALTPSLILSGKSLWTIITSMFMHGGFFHIFANMFSLFFIGGFLEKIIGKKRFFWIYMIAGIVGGLFFIGSSMIFGNLDMPAVGASGAIFGLLGVLAVLVPYSRVYLIVGPLILIFLEVLFSNILPASFIPVLSFLVNFLIILMIFSLFSFNRSFRKVAVPVELPMWLLPIIAIVPLTIISYFFPLPIGNSAHVGGLVAGLVYGLILRKQFPNKTKRLRRMFK
jgi:membrane associated rhomboid family serine protease